MKTSEFASGRIFFLGIGGVGMSALAQHYLSLGFEVGGYDRQRSEFTDLLEQLGALIWFDDRPELMPQGFADPSQCTVVYTPAIPAQLAWLLEFNRLGHRLMKRSEALAEVLAPMKVLAVAGTHGKTTTSSLLAHLLVHAGFDPTVFLGGWSLDLGGNYRRGASDWCVVEADEFDRSFLRLSPEKAVITSMEPDHLDIYGAEDEFIAGFKAFAANVRGTLFVRKGLPLDASTYALGEPADCSGTYQLKPGAYLLSVSAHELEFDALVRYPGRHNLENALAACALAQSVGLNADQLKAGLECFSGVKRRFEYVLRTDHQTFIDDYAHHPGELKALIDSVLELHPNQPLCLIFQPHLYTRTRDFADGFREQLARADRLLLLPIYPARELPIEGVESQVLLDPGASGQQSVVEPEEAVDWVRVHKPRLLVTAGAGSIDRWLTELKKALQ